MIDLSQMRESTHALGDDWQRSSSGLYLPEGLAPRRRPTAIDFFCGCGGFSLGMLSAGFEVVAAVDNDETCMMTYLYNLGGVNTQAHFVSDEDVARAEKAAAKCRKEHEKMPEDAPWWLKSYLPGNGYRSGHPDIPPVRHFYLGDVRQLTGEQILKDIGMKRGEVDCVVGGPPCQGYSTSGKREIMDPRNSLVFEYARLIAEIQPKTFIMENVPGILSMVTPEGMPVVDAFCAELESGGYGTREALKKALAVSAGAGAAVRGKTRGEKEREKRDLAEADEDCRPGNPQLGLFEEVA